MVLADKEIHAAAELRKRASELQAALNREQAKV